MSREPAITLVTTDIDGDGGVSQYTMDLFTEFKNHECDVVVSSLTDSGLLKLKEWMTTIREITKRRPEVVHVQYAFTELGFVGPIFLAILSLYCDRLVVTCHERVEAKVWYVKRALSIPSSVETLLKGLLWLYDWMVAGVADVSVVHTEQHARELDRLPMTSVKVIPHYIKQQKINTSTDSIGNVSLSRINSVSGPVLTTFGRVTPKKGHKEVIRVLPRLEDAVYIIAGDAPSAHKSYEQDLRRNARDAGVEDRVVFTGFVESDQISTLFTATDIAVLPYCQVTESKTLYDAISFGCPVITTTLSAFDVVDTWGVGMQFTKGNEDQLVRCLETVSNNRETFARQTELLASKYSLTNFAQRHLELYTRNCGVSQSDV